MNRPRLIRGLKITWTAACGVAAVLLVVLWVRSYWWMDSMGTPQGYLSARSLCGLWQAWISPAHAPSEHWYFWTKKVGLGEQFAADGLRITSNLGFAFDDERTAGWGWRIVLPCWFPPAVAGALAAAPWIRWSKRFTLRTLLITTTLVAVVLGLLVWLVR